MGPLWWLKVRGRSLGSWINCPPEVFHLCETENIYLRFDLGKLFSSHQVPTTFSRLWSMASCAGKHWKNDLAKWDKLSSFSFPFQTSPKKSLCNSKGVYVTYKWTTYTHSHMNLLIASLEKYELGIVPPCSLFWGKMSVECNMTKANSKTHQTFCRGSVVLKGSSVCQTWKRFKINFHKDTQSFLLSYFFCGLVHL